MKTHSLLHARASILVSVLLIASCGGGGGGGGTTTVATGPGSLGESLTALGVDLTDTPRLDAYGNPLPDDYSPLGNLFRMDPLFEIWLGGVRLKNSTQVAALLQDVVGNAPNSNGFITPEVLHSVSPAQAPWMEESLSSQAAPESHRDMVGADLDGDGVEEMVTVFHEAGKLMALVIEHSGNSFEEREEVLLFNLPTVRDISVAAGDFDGDAKDDLAIAYTLDDRAWLTFYGLSEFGELKLHAGSNKLFYPDLPGSAMELVLATGNVDYDPSSELVVVVNERVGTNVMSTRYHIIDDRGAGYAETAAGAVQGFEPNIGLVTAHIADVALGDIDGDRIDEILFGGLEYVANNCNSVPYVMVALDDAPSGYASLGAKSMEVAYSGCEDFDPYRLRFAYVNLLVVDGDGLQEVLVNNLLFDDWSSSAPWTLVESWSLPGFAILEEDGESWVDETNFAMACGDVNADGRDDILVWRDTTLEIRIFGIADGATQVSLLARIKTDPASSGLLNPILVTVDVDRDAPILISTGTEIGGGEPTSIFTFTEPLVLAVLAAPPCKSGINQNTDACVTTFGNTDSAGSEQELSVSFHAGISVGFDFEGGWESQSQLTMKVNMYYEVTAFTTHAYEVDKTVAFTTGANEDTVVFTTIPVDQYAYKFLYHPDPSVLGKIIRVTVPREPLFLQVEREFYNEHTLASSLKIDDVVFEHVIGDPSSYPTVSEKDARLAAFGGEELGPQSVGQGSGETSLEIEISEEFGVGGSLEVGFEFEMETVVATALFGFQVGASAEAQLSVSSGVSTSYTGTVGSIGAADFVANRYDFGLFTYVQLDPATGQEFEVINYWVE